MLLYNKAKKDAITPTQVEDIARIIGHDDCKGFSIVFKNNVGIETGEISWDNLMKLYHHIKQSEWKDEASRFEAQVSFAEPSEPTNGGWIKVKEKLPIPNDIVLVSGGCAYWNGVSWITVMHGENRPIQWEVKYWMPIPKPPLS